MDMSQYHDLFVTETREHLQRLSALAVQLETDRKNGEIIAELFRSAHSVKGMAASMGYTGIAALAHRMEDLLDRVRKGLAVDEELFDLLLAGEDRLSQMLERVAAGEGEGDAGDVIAKIAAYLPVAGDGSPAVPQGASLAPPVTAAANPQGSVDKHPGNHTAQQTVKIKTAVLDGFLDTTGELITVKHRLAAFAGKERNRGLSEAVEALGRHLRDLHDQVMTARLLPLSAVAERFPRMVRDLARKTGKDVGFVIKGAEVELDRSILELLGDPLAHLLRNCVDHGIELPQERRAAGKDASGRIELAVSRLQDQVEIRIMDDGRGIDPELIARAAVRKGIVTADRAAALKPEEKLLLICQPGFSTAARVTEVSGRGVGMDVVKSVVQSMGGTLAISSAPGNGSRFLLRLPSTIAIINVLLVQVGAFTLAIPLTAVIRTYDLKREEIVFLDGREVFFHDEETVPLEYLGHYLHLGSGTDTGETVPLFMVEVKGRKLALRVDKLLGNQEVFVKPLRRPLSAMKGLCGATVLGSGEIVFILDILNRFW